VFGALFQILAVKVATEHTDDRMRLSLWQNGVRWLLAGAVGTLLGLGEPSGGQLLYRQGNSTNTFQSGLARDLVAGQMQGNFERSLDSKESVDFLLTPVFLIQEAISDQIVLTYPAE
jgi:hypothetical protein